MKRTTFCPFHVCNANHIAKIKTNVLTKLGSTNFDLNIKVVIGMILPIQVRVCQFEACKRHKKL